jgi:hypothetical protein
MLNELQNDPNLRGRYQFWLFTYNTGTPILYSAGMLTEALRNVASELVVHSSHSTQAEPETIEEVRRILMEHLKDGGN